MAEWQPRFPNRFSAVLGKRRPALGPALDPARELDEMEGTMRKVPESGILQVERVKMRKHVFLFSVAAFGVLSLMASAAILCTVWFRSH